MLGNRSSPMAATAARDPRRIFILDGDGADGQPVGGHVGDLRDAAPT